MIGLAISLAILAGTVFRGIMQVPSAQADLYEGLQWAGGLMRAAWQVLAQQWWDAMALLEAYKPVVLSMLSAVLLARAVVSPSNISSVKPMVSLQPSQRRG
jgi:hypothetical protein